MVHQLDEESDRIHILIYKRDILRLDQYGPPGMRRSEKIRRIINIFLNGIESQGKLVAKPLSVRTPLDTAEKPHE